MAKELLIPTPRVDMRVRLATEADMPFLDQLQKMHSHMVGWFPRKQMLSYIEGEHVLIAEERHQGTEASRHRGTAGTEASRHRETAGTEASRHQDDESTEASRDQGIKDSVPLGYVIFKDQYLKRDDVGIIYQLNVLPMQQRQLIGAALVQAAFERAAYGCRLFSCWCAQDIQANWFWESIGFVPLAFRTGSRGKQRIHIFWQRRIRENDDSTAWWFPYQTQAGAVREDRIVLPIPPGTHWRDAKPLVLPAQEQAKKEGSPEREGAAELPKTLPGGAPVSGRPAQPTLTAAQRASITRAQSAHLKGVPMGKRAVITGSGIKYVDRDDFVPELDDPDVIREQAEKDAAKKKKRAARRPRAKHDKRIIQQARELRDRFLEQVNNQRLLPAAWADGKYEVSRALEGACAAEDVEITDRKRLLDAA